MATSTAQQQVIETSANSDPLKRTILIVLIAILAAGAAAGGTWYFMSRHPSREAQALSVAPIMEAPVFFPLDPMTVNLLSEDGDTHYLRIGLTLKLESEGAKDELAQHMPEIRSRVLLALSNKHPADLATLDGKRALATELATLVAQPSDLRERPVRIDDVLFTEFVVQ